MRPREVTALAVVVPAHDEEHLLPRALAALGDSAARIGALPADVIVVANGCSDGTARVAREAGATVVETGLANVGAARAAGCGVAIDRHRGDLDSLWIATTDADSLVPLEWLESQVGSAAAGHDVRVGLVALDAPDSRCFDRWVDAYEALTGGPGRHGHVHGANLGFGADAYELTGGFRAIAVGEDVDLVRRLEAAGRRVDWADDHRVITSARQIARAPSGVARDLADSLSQQIA